MCKLEVFFNKRPTASVSLMKAQKNIISVVEHVVQGRKALWGMKDDNFLFDCILCVVGKRKFAPHSGGVWPGVDWNENKIWPCEWRRKTTFFWRQKEEGKTKKALSG